LIVCTHKGINYLAVEVVHKSPISQEKLKNLEKCNIQKVIEIDAILDFITN
jgi:hypothetical protein